MNNERLSDFTKAEIFCCYKLMKDYLHDEKVEHEDCFTKMLVEIEKRQVVLPEAVYRKIHRFIDETLAPIAYEHKKAFPECYSDDIGFYNEDGLWQIKNEQSMRKFCWAFLAKMCEIEDTLDTFAMKELHPLLV